MLENLTDKLQSVVKTIRGQARFTEENISDAMREVRIALIEADVAIPVVKYFIDKVKEKALGAEVLKSVSPGQAIIKIVQDELTSLMGSDNAELNIATKPPAIVLMAGLQGSGKTTTAAKLAKYLEKNKKKKVMMASLDVYRPAAQEQLKSLGEQNNILTLPIIEGQLPADICRRAISAANLNGAEIILFDTAGRTQIDLQMMSEIEQIESIINPTKNTSVGLIILSICLISLII